jgi:uncharacterized protein YcbK (DUF882 family)
MDAEFMAKMETIRVLLGKTIKVSSAYRCASHNRLVSKTGPLGPHTTGRAIDVQVSGEDAYALLDLALSHGMTGAGISQSGPHEKRFLHFDDLPGTKEVPRPRVWSY